jgi:hypothetical protein
MFAAPCHATICCAVSCQVHFCPATLLGPMLLLLLVMPCCAAQAVLHLLCRAVL